ncbi:acyl-CoA/acyl-ACP dehydrogenase [Bacillus cereus]|nr:acyl-CoA/acyl-ACP dehydrogenase [Bacillus cereus]
MINTSPDLLNSIESLKLNFLENAKRHDQKPSFPYQNFDQVIKYSLHTVNLPKEFGGENWNSQQTCKLIMELASGCSSTALCLAMHYYSIGAFKNIFSREMQDCVFKDIEKNGRFIASINDPNIIFPHLQKDISESAKIRLNKTENGYLVNGIKTFISGFPCVHYLPVYGCIEENEGKGLGLTAVLTKLTDPGIKVDETWNYSGMRATMSYNVTFNNVFIPSDRLIGREGFGIEDTQDTIYWFRLALVSVYWGIAKTAYEHVKNLVKIKKDNISQKNFCHLPGVQFSIAEMRIKLEVAYNQIMSCARQLDKETIEKNLSADLYTNTLITKQYVTKTVNEIVWLAMQVEGSSSLQKGNLLERLYRDVRAAMFHPPAEDLLKEVIGKKELGIIPFRNRWV